MVVATAVAVCCMATAVKTFSGTGVNVATMNCLVGRGGVAVGSGPSASRSNGPLPSVVAPNPLSQPKSVLEPFSEEPNTLTMKDFASSTRCCSSHACAFVSNRHLLTCSTAKSPRVSCGRRVIDAGALYAIMKLAPASPASSLSATN